VGAVKFTSDYLKRTKATKHIQDNATCWKSSLLLPMKLAGIESKMPKKYMDKSNMMVLSGNSEWHECLDECGFMKMSESLSDLKELCLKNGPMVIIVDKDAYTGESSGIKHVINLVGFIHDEPIIVENESQFFQRDSRSTENAYLQALKNYQVLNKLLTNGQDEIMLWETYRNIPMMQRPPGYVDVNYA
jgi:hypothetical protein